MRLYWLLGLLPAVAAWGSDGEPQTLYRLSGRVVNSITGEPLAKAQLTLSDTGSERSCAAATDAGGAFALCATEAGTYELVIEKRGFVQTGQAITFAGGQPAAGIVIRMLPQGVVTGRVLDRDGDPIARATVQAIQTRVAGTRREYSVSETATSNDLGEYRIYGLNPGRYYIGSGYRSESGYAATYFPNVQEVNRAVPIDVPAGGEVQGLNLTMPEPHSMKIRGAVHSDAGLPVKGLTIVAVPCDAGPLNRATTTVGKADGAFELRDLTPGCYLIGADSFTAGKRYSARLPVTLAGKSLEDLNLRLALPVQLSGRIRAEGAPAFPFRQVIVNLEARGSRLTAGGAASSDGGLRLDNIVPHIYELSATVPDGYYVKSAQYGAVDVLRFGLDLRQGAAGQLEIDIGTDGGRIEGLVADGAERPVDGARVVLIPADSKDGALRRRVAVTNSKGAFSIRGIAPGDYNVYASRSLEAAALQDPGFLGQIRQHGKAVSIHEHGLETLQVRAIAADALPAR
jgi:hypothetical protein